MMADGYISKSTIPKPNFVWGHLLSIMAVFITCSLYSLLVMDVFRNRKPCSVSARSVWMRVECAPSSGPGVVNLEKENGDSFWTNMS